MTGSLGGDQVRGEVREGDDNPEEVKLEETIVDAAIPRNALAC